MNFAWPRSLAPGCSAYGAETCPSSCAHTRARCGDGHCCCQCCSPSGPGAGVPSSSDSPRLVPSLVNVDLMTVLQILRERLWPSQSRIQHRWAEWEAVGIHGYCTNAAKQSQGPCAVFAQPQLYTASIPPPLLLPPPRLEQRCGESASGVQCHDAGQQRRMEMGAGAFASLVHAAHHHFRCVRNW